VESGNWGTTNLKLKLHQNAADRMFPDPREGERRKMERKGRAEEREGKGREGVEMVRKCLPSFQTLPPPSEGGTEIKCRPRL